MSGAPRGDADLIVVGGGPVGLACAIEARLHGMEVLVIEPRDGPIDKACGEGLMPGALAALDRIGVDPPGSPLAGIAYVRGDARVEHRFAARPGRGVRRTVLHDALALRADERGARRLRGRVSALAQRRDGVRLELAGGGAVEAPWVIAADGLHSPVRRLLGLDHRPQAESRRRFGVRRHYAVEPWTDLVEVHWSPEAEAYVTPVDARTVGVAVLGRRPLDQDAVLASLPDLAARLEGALQLGPTRGAGPLLQRARSRASGRVLLAGDASGYVDALTGEGMRVGFAQARAAVAAVRAGDTTQYERAWRATTRDFRMLTSALVLAARSPFRPRIVPTAVARPELFGSIVERLSR
ncbi:NAD(P)/FAD-dependent oxidoreductase [Leifsonia sp. ZF2019]|uniref:NAD(P)/FAD-dependent oxidoreductase n=1 Tax=Leifsonia sp. ZF2019 TaxID=2781978 RepID=UPI001CBAC1F5|nr:NAD(P)/FAD-dependent oxidoreductase [Leifsonia sp. ZF2019]UAJ79628.1 NAD(P)/FAD-dependent oxidoreductase [Leifsonia sp. ZF2019]